MLTGCFQSTQVSSAMAARYETCPVTGNCTWCFPHGVETKNRREEWRVRAKTRSKWERNRRAQRQYKEWDRYVNPSNSVKEEIEESLNLLKEVYDGYLY